MGVDFAKCGFGGRMPSCMCANRDSANVFLDGTDGYKQHFREQ